MISVMKGILNDIIAMGITKREGIFKGIKPLVSINSCLTNAELWSNIWKILVRASLMPTKCILINAIMINAERICYDSGLLIDSYP